MSKIILDLKTMFGNQWVQALALLLREQLTKDQINKFTS